MRLKRKPGRGILPLLRESPAFALGFRPFYLAAALFSILALTWWLAVFFGIAQGGGYLQGIAWHSHEMMFGFATAVVAGFLMTAVRNWTGQPTPTGALLAGLVAIWMLGRVLVLTGPAAVAVLVDVAFLPVLGVAVAVPIWRSRNRRNIKILAVIAGLAIANIVFHLAYRDVLPAGLARAAVTAALDLFTILMAIIGGRVIPAFTANAITGASPRRVVAIEVLALGTLVLILVAGVLAFWYPVPMPVWTGLLAAGAIAHAVRLSLWQPHRTFGNALLCMLPVAYAWIPITLALRLLALLEIVPTGSAVHALTVGAMGGLMVAMMMRSALGHTGRTLAAGWAESAVFVLVQLAAVVRVFGAALWPALYAEAIVASGVLWTLAFTVFVLRYVPILTRPRIDGQPG